MPDKSPSPSFEPPEVGTAQNHASTISDRRAGTGPHYGYSVNDANKAGFDVKITTTTGYKSETTVVTVRSPITGETGVAVHTGPPVQDTGTTIKPGTTEENYRTKAVDRFDIPPEDLPAQTPPEQDQRGDESPQSEPETDIPAEKPETPPAPPPEDAPNESGDGEDEQTEKPEEKSEGSGDAKDPCNYCVDGPGPWEQHIPVWGPLRGALSDITNGIHTGNIAQIAVGLFGLMDAASDVMMVSSILKKIGKKAVKAALKEALKQIAERMKDTAGLNPEEAALGYLADQMGLKGDEKKVFIETASRLFDIQRSKNNSPNSNVSAADGKPTVPDIPGVDTGTPDKPGIDAGNPDGPPVNPDRPSKNPPTRIPTNVRDKILTGEFRQNANGKYRLVGAHSASVKSDPRFDHEVISNNPDGTTTVKIVTQAPNGDLVIKGDGGRHVLAPDKWDDKKIMDVTKQVGDSPPKVVEQRPDGNYTKHQQTIEGVQWEVIKGPDGVVTSSYPTGGIPNF